MHSVNAAAEKNFFSCSCGVNYLLEIQKKYCKFELHSNLFCMLARVCV